MTIVTELFVFDVFLMYFMSYVLIKYPYVFSLFKGTAVYCAVCSVNYTFFMCIEM